MRRGMHWARQRRMAPEKKQAHILRAVGEPQSGGYRGADLPRPSSMQTAVAEGSSSGNPRRIRRIPSLGPSLPRLTSRRNTQESRLHQTTIPPTISSPIRQPRPNHNPTKRNGSVTLTTAAPVSAPARKQPLRGTHRQSYKVSSYPYCVLNGCDYRICIMKARTFCVHSPTSERNAPLPSNLTREIFEPGVANGKFWTGFTGLTGFFSLNLVNPVAV